jgi:excisionase family DNA binding protein
MEPVLVRPEEAAEMLRLSRARVYELIGSGELPSVKVGRFTRVSVDVLREWVAVRSRREPKE